MKRPPKNIGTPSVDPSVLEAIASAVQPVELSESLRNAMRQKIMDRITNDLPARTRTVRNETVDWLPAWPNVWVKLLRQDARTNLQVVLLRIKAGGVVPAHVHTKEEECLVLDGEIFIGSHRMREGDFHVAAPGAAHGDITTRIGATVLVRSEITPEHLKSLLAATAER